MAVKEINSNEFKELVLKKELLLLADFYAPWCTYCRQIEPVLNELSEKHPELTVVKINIDKAENTDLSVDLNISTIPALLFYRDGKLQQHLAGFFTGGKLLKKLGL